MLSELYEITLRNKQEIIRNLDNLGIEQHNVSEFWNNHSADEDPNATIGAEDGSMNKKEFKGYVLYAVDAEALNFDGSKLDFIPAGEVGIFPRQSFIDNRLRLYMSLYEFKVSLRSIEKFHPDVFLLDGSLISELVRSMIPASYISKKQRTRIGEKYLSRIESTIDSAHFSESICAKQFRDEIREDAKGSGDAKEQGDANWIGDAKGSGDANWIGNAKGSKDTKKSGNVGGAGDMRIDPNVYLEYLEYLLSIRQILKHNPVGISKTSAGRDYFESEIPDIILFEKVIRTEGYSKPKQVSIDKALKRLPLSPEISRKFFNGFFDNLEFTIFYARLADNATVLKFEIPGRINEREIEELLARLKAISVEGYPYLLKKAHNDVVIKNRDMNRISKILGIFEKTGREIL